MTPDIIETMQDELVLEEIGIQGIPGRSAFLHIKWAASQPTQDSDMKDTPDAWVGLCNNSSAEAPAAYTAYTWFLWRGDAFVYSDFTPEQLAFLKGEKGDKGDQGDKGDAFVYTDFTPEQLALLKGEKGDKGDAFVYSDFTPEQLALLKGEKGDKGDQGDAFTYADFTAEQLATLVGATGATGRGISAVERTAGTGAAGTTDTYTITYSDSTASIFTVYNGADGEGAGDMLKSVYVDAGGTGKVLKSADSDKLGGVDASGYAKEISGQTALTYLEIDDSDAIPLYDTSTSTQKKTLISSLKNKFSSTFLWAYQLTTAETNIEDSDYFQFYDTSEGNNRKSLWSNIKSVLKTYFDTLYAGLTHKSRHASGGADALSPADIGAATSGHNHDSSYAPKHASGSSTTNSTTGCTITHTFGSIAATAYRVTITPTLTGAPTTSNSGNLGEVYAVKNADGTFTVYNTGAAGIAFDWIVFKV